MENRFLLGDLRPSIQRALQALEVKEIQFFLPLTWCTLAWLPFSFKPTQQEAFQQSGSDTLSGKLSQK